MSRNESVSEAFSTLEYSNVLRGRWESEPAVTVREPRLPCHIGTVAVDPVEFRDRRWWGAQAYL